MTQLSFPFMDETDDQEAVEYEITFACPTCGRPLPTDWDCDE